MKKNLLLSVSLFLSAAIGAQTNLMVNGDFEEPYINNLPSGWLLHQVDGGSNINAGMGPTATITFPSQNGEKYHRMTNMNANQWSNLQQIVHLAPGNYKLSFYLTYQGTATNVDFDVLWIGAADEATAKANRPGAMANILKITNTTGTIDTEWKKQTTYFKVGAGEEWARFCFRKSGAQWYLDNVVLEAVAEIPSSVSSQQKASCQLIVQESSLLVRSTEEATASIYSSNGTLLSTTPLVEGENLLSTEGLNKGAYFMRIATNSNNTEVFKFAK